jgi:protein gp37
LWLGVTAENQARADERIPILLQIQAAVRFVSYEPGLGPVSLTDQAWWDHRYTYDFIPGARRPLDWVICGGETGPGARPMHPDWVRSLKAQCQAAGVAFFFKGWGDWLPECQWNDEAEVKKPHYSYPWNRHEWDYLTGKPVSWRVGKKAAGRLLDGREWSEFPKQD